MPSRSICPDSRQTFLAWEPQFCPDCREALIGIIRGPGGEECRSCGGRGAGFSRVLLACCSRGVSFEDEIAHHGQWDLRVS